MESFPLPAAGSLCVFAIAVFMAVMALWLYARKPGDSWNAWSSLISLGTAAYALAAYLQYVNPTIDHYHRFQLTGLTAIIVIIHGTWGFTFAYLRIPAKRYHLLFGPLHGALAALIWCTPVIVSRNAVLLTDMVYRRAPLDLAPGPLGTPFIVYITLAGIAAVVVWMQRIRRIPRGRRGRMAFIAGIGLWSLLGLHDALASAGMPTVMFLVEYGFLGYCFSILSITIGDYTRLSGLVREREDRLARQTERLGTTLRSIDDAVISTDGEGRITVYNHAAELLTGTPVTDAIGSCIDEVLELRHPATRDPSPVDRSSPGTTAVSSRHILISRGGGEHIVDIWASTMQDDWSGPGGIFLVCRDMTERLRDEEELLKVRNIESLGVLAGGIAHDFNNILTRILGHLTLAGQELPEGSAVGAILENARHAIHDAHDLATQLLTFARGGAPIKKTADIGDLVADTAAFALRGSPSSCRLTIDPGLWPLEFDRSQISQVIQNIVINAAQAMTGRPGIIGILARNISFMEPAPTLPAGPYVMIAISDNGPGIPDEMRSRIFDPYFTTKGEGTGLGLTSAYSIVRRHGGHITTAPADGGGTVFTIYLPACPGVSVAAPEESPALTRGRGYVLIMDDDADIRRVGARMLKSLGYDVMDAADGDEAIAAYCRALEAGRPVDCVIMDLTVPGGMGGAECVTRLRCMAPHVRAIVSSGYCTDPVMANHREHGFDEVLAKPYTIEELSRVLDAVMAANHHTIDGAAADH